MGITLWQMLGDRTSRMVEDAFQGIGSLDDWLEIRAERHREFMQSLGLDPLPPRCELKLTDYGSFAGPGYKARKLAFQIMPDCWQSACLYYPDPLPAGAAPAVLYVCGHGAIGTSHYQAHPMKWARRGYVCLIVDTIEQNDNPGEHHGSFVGRGDEWLSLGYTPAGAEVWNAMRALDVLAADPRVDPERLAVTGVSGGGACSFHATIADARIKAVSTLCGICSPYDAVVNGHLMGHCDCMFPINRFARDISEYGALIAPRAALFCFTDQDKLYSADETRALVERTRYIYGLYGQDERCGLATCPGAHSDKPQLDAATNRWFDTHVAGEARPRVERGERELPESTISVFHGCPPAPNHMDLLPGLMTPRGTVPLPRNTAEWDPIRRAALERLRSDVLHASGRASMRSHLEPVGDWLMNDDPQSMIVRAHAGVIEDVAVGLHMALPPTGGRDAVLSVAVEGEAAEHAMNRLAGSLDSETIYAGFQPRVFGFNSSPATSPVFPPGAGHPTTDTLLLRAMALTGSSFVMLIIEDIAEMVCYLRTLPEWADRPFYLCGKGIGGVAALYYGLLEDGVAGVAVEDLPSSHLHGASLPGILRVLDIPQAVGLMAPRKVALVNRGHSFWTWPQRAYERLGCAGHFMMAADLRQGLRKIAG